MKLFTYFRSSAAHRVRIALNLKGIPYEQEFVNLQLGNQQTDEYMEINPQGFVPVLVDDSDVLTQSLAIIEYLEEKYPNPALLPRSTSERAHVRALALTIACDIHPLNNLRVRNYLQETLGIDEDRRLSWHRHWVTVGLGAVEAMLVRSGSTGKFCCGHNPTIADICLVPQITNALRFGCDMSMCPTVMRINEVCSDIPAFKAAAPENQPDIKS